ncbi:MAG TPA: hypothetical protein VF054_07160 [Micromonosporaceae bacterium]
MGERAVIYTRAGLADAVREQRAALGLAERCGYELVALVVDPDGSRWPEVVGMLATGAVDVAVLARLTDMPSRGPRVEFADTARRPVRVGERRGSGWPTVRRPERLRGAQ